MLIAIVCWYEYSRLLKKKEINLPYGMGLSLVVIILLCAWFGNVNEQMAINTMILMLILSKMILGNKKLSALEASFTFFGVNYIGLFSYLILLRQLDSSSFVDTAFGQLSTGAIYVWLPLVATWGSDTFAYFCGKKWGKTKLCPAISPGKTIEGFLGGVFGSIIVTVLLGALFKFPFFHATIIGILAGLIAPLGDLAESALKRFAGSKDSGSLLPGHGGMLDRFDSIMFVVPGVYYYIVFFVFH
jgi:phosphatidate cytidylyltransferase